MIKMYDLVSPLRNGGSLIRADPAFIRECLIKIGVSTEEATNALGNMAALESIVQRDFSRRMYDFFENCSVVAGRREEERALISQSQIKAMETLGVTFGNFKAITDYIQDYNIILGCKCKRVISDVIKNSSDSVEGMAKALGVSKGYLEIALLRCAYGT